MKLSDYAQIAEIVSGIAVVITLIFVVVEIRNNTEVTKAATFDSIQADLADYQLQSLNNEEFGEIVMQLQSGGVQSLSPRQLEINTVRTLVQFKHYERAFSQWKYGNLDDEAWERFRNSICRWRGEEFEQIVGSRIENNSIRSFIDYRRECVEASRVSRQN